MYLDVLVVHAGDVKRALVGFTSPPAETNDVHISQGAR